MAREKTSLEFRPKKKRWNKKISIKRNKTQRFGEYEA